MLAVDRKHDCVPVFMTARCVVCVQLQDTAVEFACVVSILYAQDNDADASLQTSAVYILL